ncbi:MAG: sigma-54-dependent Fis family transcriptional regulator [candidate division Zixibacteria bacterium]|nr:sigma-54-dependent Fis family transcriptional regulator [candidate division Zixibacteria bacterium]
MGVEIHDQFYASLPHGKLARLCALARLLSSEIDERRIQTTLITDTLSLLDADYGSIQLMEEDMPLSVTLQRREGTLDAGVARSHDRLLVGWVAQNHSALRTADLSDDSRVPFLNGEADARLAALASPIFFHEQLVGVLIVARSVTHPFADDDEALLGVVTDLAASVLNRMRRLRLLAEEVDTLRRQLAREGQFAGLVGRSPAWQNLCSTLAHVAPSEARVLLLGESGTGKELCARAIHDMSPRRDRPFVAVNCAALPEALAESELFGYVRGAFTGATQDHRGLFAHADGGTLFLDEIGSASLPVQSSLLRVIQDGQMRPVGSVTTVQVNVRLVCATSCDLEAMASSGTFRQDLYFRINVVTLSLSPLRERREDIAMLAGEFLRRYASRETRDISGLSPEALVALENYHWPGNVRELQNAIERAVLFCPPGTQTVPVEALPEKIRSLGGKSSARDPAPTDGGLDTMVEYYEREIVRTTLENCQGNQSQAARVLKIPESRIRDRVKKYGLRAAPSEASSPGAS